MGIRGAGGDGGGDVDGMGEAYDSETSGAEAEVELERGGEGGRERGLERGGCDDDAASTGLTSCSLRSARGVRNGASSESVEVVVVEEKGNPNREFDSGDVGVVVVAAAWGSVAAT